MIGLQAVVQLVEVQRRYYPGSRHGNARRPENHGKGGFCTPVREWRAGCAGSGVAPSDFPVFTTPRVIRYEDLDHAYTEA